MSHHQNHNLQGVQRRDRSGVTLLFVVSMIVLFLLMGTAFVLVSNDFFRASKKRSTKHVFSTDHQSLVEQAFYDLLRGPELSDPNSPLRGHSLLADMYGYGFTATIASAAADSSGHFISLQLGSDTTRIIDRAGFTIEPIDGLLSGLVISVTDGPAKGLSARIVDHQVDRRSGGTTHRLVVLPTKLDRGFDLASAGRIAGASVIVNGRPFTGSGAGHYDPFTPRSEAGLSDAALAPNQSGRTLDQLIGNAGTANSYFSISTSAGGAAQPNSAGPNESYDTFDYQNMFLAGLRSDGTVVAPSFHRAGLAAIPGNPGGDFRAITDGGPANDGVRVDNNNDGIPDGIWIDAGLPIQARSDGRRVKPLVSYTVIDMGSKLNVNAHGSPLRETDGQFDPIELLGSGPGSRGQGLGPPEINLSALIPNVNIRTDSGQQRLINPIMHGLGSLPGRYGIDQQPGEAGVRDGWSGYKLFGYPNATFAQSVPGTVSGLFSSVMDIHGRFSFGYPSIFDVADAQPISPIGMPVANVGVSSLANEIVDSPYEMTFAGLALGGPGDNGFDAPFEPAELEAVLRRRDPDSNLLPRRLLELGGFDSGTAANSVTTDSFEVPTTFDSLPESLYRILNTVDTATNQGIPLSTPNRAQQIANQMKVLLPPEVFRGLPMNVNREFGDGVDNNLNGITDEIGEADQISHPSGEKVNFDHDNDGVVGGDVDSHLARVNFARHLYIVTLLAGEQIDRDGDGKVTLADWYDFNDDGTIDEDDRVDFRRVIAQWAINVVDFRDPDSIMTAFEADLNPFNGWDVDGDVSSVERILEGSSPRDMRAVFWGAERPELLISETLATHDRRTQDLAIEVADGGASGTQTNDAEEPDADFDSHLVPKVSVFFELYNPWVMNDANQIRSAELYDADLNGVELQKLSLDGTSPVWRLVVTDNLQNDLDPDESSNNDRGESAKLLRRIYFSQPSPSVDAGAEVYHPDAEINAGPVAPGRYAIVGTQGPRVAHDAGDRYDVYFGRRVTPTWMEPEELQNLTRRISLDWQNGNIHLLSWDKSKAPDGDSEQFVESIRPVAALPIGQNQNGFRELGVSDPVAGYFELKSEGGIDIDVAEVEDGLKFVENSTGAAVDFAFDQPVDQLVDEDHYNRYLLKDGLCPGYRTVHLQRLANPLNAHNARTNPYRTIDSSSLDLFVFNGAAPIGDPLNVPDVMRFGTYERRCDLETGHGQQIGRHRLLFKNDTLGRVSASNEDDLDGNGEPDVDDDDCEGFDKHVFSRNFAESFANLNDAYRRADPENPKPFCWLAWNNRPFASQLELANVPHTSSYQMTRLFDISSDSSRDVYDPPNEEQEFTRAGNYSAHFPHLLNFYADQTDGGGRFAASLHRLFDYLEVPSRFVGTESHVNPTTFVNSTHDISFGLSAPFDTISSYRYPGKININTVLDPEVWGGLMDFYAGGTDPVSLSDWELSRKGIGSFDFSNPLRAAKANNLVPQAAGAVVDPVECGLFRRGPGGSGAEPLFDYRPATTPAQSDPDRAAYFKYDMRQRLGNLVTTRSSVFAVWITVGYFEVEFDGSVQSEWGASTGGLVRNRGFFLVDRSIPVAFEPGKNHNVDRAVLVKTLIE